MTICYKLRHWIQCAESMEQLLKLSNKSKRPVHKNAMAALCKSVLSAPDMEGIGHVRVRVILYYTILYYTILYYTILYYTILYYTILST